MHLPATPWSQRLASLNAKRQLAAQPGEDYGLADPAVTVTVTAAGETNTFAFGSQNPVTGDLYVQKTGDDAIYTVSGNKAACFEQTKADLFGTFNPAGLTASALESVSIATDTGTLSLTAVSETAGNGQQFSRCFFRKRRCFHCLPDGLAADR